MLLKHRSAHTCTITCIRSDLKVRCYDTWVDSRVIIVRVDVDAAMAEPTQPLHAHQSIDVDEEQVKLCHIAQLFPPVHCNK